MVIDKNQSVILINQNGCRILGYTENEIIGKNWFELILPRVKEYHPDLFLINLWKGK
ncbi:MAG: PAS domain S-box protein [Bacteroidetes bacterium]|nr:PAS domain S-box protein [Bacteroidota bacterium]